MVERNKLEFVYQPVPATSNDSAFDSAIARLREGTGEILIASPYLSTSVLNALVGDRAFRLVTDQDECFGKEVGLRTFMEMNQERVRSLRGLHAKVVISEAIAMFGSANITESGFTRRYEMSVMVSGDDIGPLRGWFEQVWAASEPIDYDNCERGRIRAEKIEEATASSTRNLPRTGTLTKARSKQQSRTNPSNVSLGEGGSPNESPSDPQHSVSRLGESGGAIEGGEFFDIACALRESSLDSDSFISAMEFLRKGLAFTGLDLEDPRLHLNYKAQDSISITVGQRWVAWLRPYGKIKEVGLILSDSAIATRFVEDNPSASIGYFTRNNQTDAIALHASLENLPDFPDELIDDWRAAIAKEVVRAKKSSFLAKKTPALWWALNCKERTEEVTRLAHSVAWWFGVNNGPIGKGHVHISEIQTLFGSGGEFKWDFKHSKTSPSGAYRRMWAGDEVLIWVGRGNYDSRWGVYGSATVMSVAADHLILHNGKRFVRPVQPYSDPKGGATESSEFLFGVFGEEFLPLGDVRSALRGVPRRNPITIAQINRGQIASVVKFAER